MTSKRWFTSRTSTVAATVILASVQKPTALQTFHLAFHMVQVLV